MPELQNPATGRIRSVSAAQEPWYRKRGWVDANDIDLMANAGTQGAAAGTSMRAALEPGADEGQAEDEAAYFLASAGYNPDPPDPTTESTDI